MRYIDEPSLDDQSLNEPSVLDWFKSLLRFEPIPLPSLEQSPVSDEGIEAASVSQVSRTELNNGQIWQLAPAKLRTPIGIALALLAQLLLTQRTGVIPLNIFIYLLGASLVVWAVLAGDFTIPSALPRQVRGLAENFHWRPLAIGLALGFITFLTAAGNRFRLITVIAWLGSIIFTVAAFFELSESLEEYVNKRWSELRLSLQSISINRWQLVLFGAFLIIAFFRLNHLARLPYEMWSDQAEKLLDVRDVLEGQTKIFFPRNSGREAIEFYWAVLVYKVFNTGLSFLTLKIVSASAGLLALPFIYLLGKELGGRRVGFFALFMAGVAFWPNINSRAGLRMPLNEMFVAPALFFLVRGLRTGRRNDLLWAGLAVGLGLQGYSGARVVPLAVLLGWLLYLAHERNSERRRRSVIGFSSLIIVSFFGVLPLLRFFFDEPNVLLYRTLTRMGTLEQPYQMNPILQFLKNYRDILFMFSWDNGPIWILNIIGRPVLDWITGGFFHLGIVLTLVAYLRKRRWHSIFLILALLVLLLPSVLALAFPNENPAPNRVTGAIVPVSILAAIGLDSFYRWMRRQFTEKRQLASLLVVALLLFGVAIRNYYLVFSTYATSQRVSTWNASEAGRVMKGFADSVGDFEDIYFVVYPHWIDSRLAAIEAGAPIRDHGIFPEDLADQQLDEQKYHLFFIKPEDIENMRQLTMLHPRGTLSFHRSEFTGRDFYLYLVPPKEPAELPTES